ncbi:MAG: hypothetical protein COT85_02040 [Chlamydiae bacterium CG10_big_fil_rev_8_21_14_0_10_42_34]|nr:MAG: hypothetical protein COT85_02040 [Chlamydiae bacterium CG10_big_fil_rev_8_21_14_0_10_42_34]
MFVEKENQSSSEPLFLNTKQRLILREDVLKTAFRFPKLFNRPLYRSFEQMVVNSPGDFLTKRTSSHLRMILCVQFFMQKRIESILLQEGKSQKQLFLKLFRGPSRICVCLVSSSSLTLQKEQLLKALDAQLPGISEIPKSFYLWHSAEHPYYYCYFEVNKLRGNDLSSGQLRAIEKALKNQMQSSSPLTPAVFWPYNKEESHRQIQILIREMKSKQDLPHISIHFQEQTSSSLEFLVHLVRPKAKQALALEKLPESLYFFRYTKHILSTPFSIEVEAFSIKMQAELFDVRETINLLYARRYLSKQLEAVIGPFRDYNGGLFEKQQDHFEMVRLQLSSKIPYFELFAEKVFYALHPFEKWFSLNLSDVEDLLLVFSQLIQDPRSCTNKSTPSGLFTVVKTENRVDFLRFAQKQTDTNELSAYAQLTIGNHHYECFSGKFTKQIDSLMHCPVNEKNALKLIFQEGLPPSLNPHYSAGDMRCRLLNKMLFEGLTRLNHEGKPELAGAKSYHLSDDKRTYTFHLRKASWSNGEKVTAFDYADSWKWTLQDAVSHPELLFSIKNAKRFREKKCFIEQVGVRVINPETLQIELEESDSEFLYKLSQPFFFPLFGNSREPKWFNGPYLVETMNKNGIKLGRNPYFWKSSKETFEQVDVQWIDNIHTIFSLFKAGKIDWIGDPTSILSFDQISELQKDGLLQKKVVPRRFSLHFNTKHPVLSSVPIRRALSLAIDRSLICQEIFPHSIPSTNGNYSKQIAVAFFEEGLRELKLTRESFPTISFSYSDQTRRDELASYLQTTWSNLLGIRVELEKNSWNTFRSKLEHRNFEICGTIQDTLNLGSLNYLERFEGTSSWNFSQWSHLVYRELISSAKKESDPIKQYELKVQAENILAENTPSTPLFDYVHLYALSPRFDCSHFDAEGCVDFSQGKIKEPL